MPSKSVARVALVVALLGALGGAVTGTLWYFGVALWALRGELPTGRDALYVLTIGAAAGAVAGMVLGPLVGFTLLRRVPLGRAIAFTGAGTLAGLVVSVAMRGRYPIVLTLGGFVAGALAARLLATRAASASDRQSRDTGRDAG